MATDKSRKNADYNTYNKAIIKRLREKYGTSPHFIYASLRGDRQSETSEAIVKDYKRMDKEINKVLNQL